MNKIIAYCGLVCSDCSAYIATQADDQEALEKVAAQWREQYNVPNITVASVLCDGCLEVGASVVTALIARYAPVVWNEASSTALTVLTALARSWRVSSALYPMSRKRLKASAHCCEVINDN